MAQTSPSTKTLDHIVHLTPPGTVEEVSQQFRDLGFKVTPGGTHAGGLTANALVILGDGAYLELISFTHPASHYPPGSPDRQKRDANPWAWKEPGWIDYAFLGSAAASISSIINERAGRDGSGVRYVPEVDGGRVREDGTVLEWVISAPGGDHVRGTVPFFCGDVTPRSWRVPVEPPSNSEHPSGVQGVAYVRLLAEAELLARLSAQLTSVVGEIPQTNTMRTEYIWSLKTPSGASGVQRPLLILSEPRNDEEDAHLAAKGPGIFEIAFSVGQGGTEKQSMTPYGRIVWLRSQQ
ncbi:glyoxalase-like domain-containing protein [Melanogaster broomeanus]|nr:glyoxalase-like domain-containing protein [Melanogaster broomeanus]